MTLHQHQALLGTVRVWEMQRLNDMHRRFGGKRASTVLHLSALSDHDLFGPAVPLKKHVTLTRHRLLVYHAVSRAIQLGKIPPPAAPWKSEAMLRLLYAVNTEDWSEATSEERKACQTRFTTKGRLLAFVSSIPDKKVTDL